LSIRGRLLVIALATLLPCVVLVALWVYLERGRETDRALKDYESEAHRIAERLASTVDEVRALLTAVEVGFGARIAEGEANDESLGRLIIGAPRVVAWISLVDARGRIVSSSAVPVAQRPSLDVSDRDYFQAAMRTRAFAIGAPVVSRVTGEPIVIMAQPILSGDAVAGFAVAVVEVARFGELVEPRHGEAVVTVSTDRGAVLYRPGRPELWGRDASALRQHAAGRGGEVFRGETRDLDGTEVLGASVPVRNAPWQVFYAEPKSAALAAVDRTLAGAILVALATLLTGLAVAGWIARGLVLEIQRVRRGVNALARGDLSHRVDASAGGELGQLAADVNRMAENLGEAEQRLHSLIALSSDFFWETDTELRFTRVEGTIRGSTPSSRDAAIGKRFWDLGLRLNGDVAAHQGVFDRREPFRDVEIVRAEPGKGVSMVLHVSGEPRFASDGAFLGYRGIGRDVTERNMLEAEVRRAQVSLARSEERFRSVAEMSSDWIWETDAEHRFAYFSSGFERATGIPAARALGKRRWDVPASNMTEVDWAAHRAALDRREPFTDLRLERTAADGRRIVQSISGRPVLGPGGEFLGYRGVGSEISARVAAEEALRAEHDRLARVLETMVEGLSILDAEGRYVMVNAAGERILGARREEVLGRHFTDVPWTREPFEGRVSATPESVFERLRAGAEKHAGPESYVVRRTDGTVRYLNHQVARLEDGAGNFAGVVATFEDVTERLKAEKEHEREVLALNADLERRVEERTAELTAAYKEMESFSYSVSHDLRAPLRAISGFSRILLEDFRGEIPAEAERLLARVAQNAERMGALIDGLLEFGRLSRQPLRLQRVRPADIVREVLEELAPLREGRRIDVRVGDMPECEADRVLLKQVYANLIANAIKYTALRAEARIEAGSITMGLGPVYYVRDNGVGFDMSHAGKLFAMFQRLHLASEFEGNGVGLALVRRIVERHGGKVWADSAPEKGATFFFRLSSEAPAARADGARAA
jgi:PAS domain S-box-containing protein